MSGKLRTPSLALAPALLLSAWVLAAPGDPARTFQDSAHEPADVAAFRATAGDQIAPVTIELRSARDSAARVAGLGNLESLQARARARLAQQDAFIAALPARGIRILPAQVQAPQADGSVRTIKFRYTNVLNGFSAWVATGDIARLRQQPEVQSVQVEERLDAHLDRAINYSLGSQFELSNRRLAVYGPTEEMLPAGGSGHPETPMATTVDGYEGAGLAVSVIDTGVDWKHPMFGGTGQTTPTPQVPPAAPSASDNKKVTYVVNFTAGDSGDDYGHGTFVASNAAGYRVDGNTAPVVGYGLNVGPTPGGALLHGTAPQATIMTYKTLSTVGVGLNQSTQLALDDSASPCVAAVETTGCVRKPIADVINLSLGGDGSASSASTKAANNAALAGAIVVASAGNSGPDASTVGAPCMGTMVICIGASLDPGSISSGAVLAPNQIPGELSAGKTPSEGATAGPPPETGAASEANTPQPGEQQAIRLFSAAGGGPVPQGSVSAHYVYADMTVVDNTAPVTVTNRIALVRGTGAFATIANSVAALDPVAILIITTVESATAVAVLNGIPTFTIAPASAQYLLDLMRAGVPGPVPHGTVSQLPLRITDGVALDVYEPAMTGFSSRGPNAVPGSDYRNIKPDVTAPGAGILAAATPDGTPSPGGMGELSGYTVASGTSFSGPITAGAMVLVRERVRKLGFDTTDLADPNYRTKRFEAATIARALIQNNATNLRSGRGVPQPDSAAVTTIHDFGSGHIEVDAALTAQAIMVAPTKLLGNGAEFDLPALNPPQLDANGHLDVLLPTYSFGRVGVANSPGVLAKTNKVVIRDITAGGGAGTYSLAVHDDLNSGAAGVSIGFLAMDGVTPITSVNVPNGGSAEFLVRIAVDGTLYTQPNTDILWYVNATHGGSGKTLRTPFYLRAVAFVSSLVTAAPAQGDPTLVETPAAAPACGTDTNGAYTLHYSYTVPPGGTVPIGFRVQEGTTASALFQDAASEPLVAGANSLWTGSPQWTSSTNPDTGNLAYFVPDTAEQNEALTMIAAITLPARSTLSFRTFQDTELNFDFAVVELIVNGVTVELGTFSGSFAGTRTFDLSPYGGAGVRVQFRMTSDLLVPGVGWWIENIRIEADDFTTIAEPAAGTDSLALAGKNDGTRHYRIAALFNDAGSTVAGPYSNTRCVTVNLANKFPVANAGADFSVKEGANVRLDGSATDAENDPLTFQWTQTAGPTVALSNATTPNASFVAPQVDADTPLTFRLRVTDSAGGFTTDDVTVTVLNVPAGVPGNTRLGGSLPAATLMILGLLALARRRGNPAR